MPNEEKTAYLIVGIVKGEKVVEAYFTLLKSMHNNASILVYARRFYGDNVGDELVGWMNSNGLDVEKALVEFNSYPAKY